MLKPKISSEPCAIWLFPYRNIDLTKLLIKRKRANNKNFDPDKPEQPTGPDDDAAIISNVMHYSPRPQFIRDAAAAFVAEQIGTWDMVAMHWRYDKDDFMVHCQKVQSQVSLEITPIISAGFKLTKTELLFTKHYPRALEIWRSAIRSPTLIHMLCQRILLYMQIQ